MQSLLLFLLTATKVLAFVALQNGHSIQRRANSSNVLRCNAFATSLNIPNVTVLAYGYHLEGEQIELPGLDPSCAASYNTANITQNLCRVVISAATSPNSEVLIEGWLPDAWNHRLLASGNGGLSGCVDFMTLQAGGRLGFATFGTNAGHNGSSGYQLFLNKPETLKDFGYRGIHLEAQLGKQLVKQYYNSSASYSYYSGCSTGGRQAHTAASRYPNDFNGILAGAPGTNTVVIVSAKGIFTKRAGWPDIHSPGYVRPEQFTAITQAQIELFDHLDGVKDGIIDDPASHNFDPELLACGLGILNSSLCLTPAQVETVRSVYQPISNTAGQPIFPGPVLGASTALFSNNIVNGTPVFPYAILTDLFRSTIYNDTTWTPNNFNETDMDKGIAVNPGGVNSPDTDLSSFKAAGGKLLVYHGQADQAIPSGNTIRYLYNVQRALNLTVAESHDFYRLFLIPGMQHCGTGVGAWNIGQTTIQLPDARFNTTANNVLLALVDWVENGNAPTSIVGSRTQGNVPGASILAQRTHCLYPDLSDWDGSGNVTVASSWKCSPPSSLLAQS